MASGEWCSCHSQDYPEIIGAMSLQEGVGQVGQAGTLALFKSDVSIEVFAAQSVDDITKAIGLLVQVRCVNLPNVTR